MPYKRNSAFDRFIFNIFEQGEKAISKELRKVAEGKKISYGDRLGKIVDEMKRKFNKRSGYRIPEEHLRGSDLVDRKAGLDRTLKQLENLLIDEAKIELDDIITGSLGTVHIERINESIQIARDINEQRLKDLEKNIRSVLIPDYIDELRSDIANQTLSKQKRINILTDRLEKDGVFVIKDSRGHRLKPRNVASTIVRTEANNAHIQGTITRGLEVGVTRFIRRERDGCCIDQCGAVKDKDIRDARQSSEPPYTTLHPNCGGWREPIISSINE